MPNMMQMHSKKQADGTIEYTNLSLTWVPAEGLKLEPIQQLANDLGMTNWSMDKSIVLTQGKKKDMQTTFTAMHTALEQAGYTLSDKKEFPLCIMETAVLGKAKIVFGVQFVEPKSPGNRDPGLYAGLMIDREIKWINHPDIEFGETSGLIVLTTEECDASICIQDLQSGNEYCFTADQLTQGDFNYVKLFGNGWKEQCGFPYISEGGHYYPLLAGKTAKKMIALCNDGKVPNFDEVWSGNPKDLKDWATAPEMQAKGLPVESQP